MKRGRKIIKWKSNDIGPLTSGENKNEIDKENGIKFKNRDPIFLSLLTSAIHSLLNIYKGIAAKAIAKLWMTSNVIGDW